MGRARAPWARRRRRSGEGFVDDENLAQSLSVTRRYEVTLRTRRPTRARSRRSGRRLIVLAIIVGVDTEHAHHPHRRVGRHRASLGIRSSRPHRPHPRHLPQHPLQVVATRARLVLGRPIELLSRLALLRRLIFPDRRRGWVPPASWRAPATRAPRSPRAPASSPARRRATRAHRRRRRRTR